MQGLTKNEVELNLKQYGLNVLKEHKGKPILLKFIEQFNNFLTILLLVAAIVSLLIGEMVDGILIVGIVILNALFGFYQEAKAEESLAALKKMTVTKIRVIRDGQEQEIDSKYLVPGDIMVIEEGVKIPADAELLEVRNLEVNEASLTGESMPVLKEGLPSLDVKHIPADKQGQTSNESHLIFAGTIVTKGRGFARVMQTGMSTKFGQIAASIKSIKEPKTPLQKKLEGLTRSIGLIGITISLLVLILSIMSGGSYFHSFLLAISLAVAVVPEGLQAVMTITLALGMREMAKAGAIIRKLSTIEALGSITIIATDKTGTITANKMKVKEVFVEGNTYDEGNLPHSSNHPFNKLMLDGIICSTASLVFVHDHGGYDVLGDPTEGALLFLAHKIGWDPKLIRAKWELIEEIPFDSVTKRMSVIVSKRSTSNTQHMSETYLFSKGAPESILEISKSIMIGEKEETLTPAKIKEIEGMMEKWASRGLRVLAFSYKKISDSKLPGNWKLEINNSQVFLGMVAIHDPPRPEVLDALVKTKKAGIRVVMITGDNPITAEAIGVSTGIMKIGDEILTGDQLDTFSDKDLLVTLPKVKVFARTTPFHKARIVRLYQEMGEVVAVTGDGVNDAVALKTADVGVAMGLVGTDVARETSDMVITDDNFATIVGAIEEGRNIIKHLQNAITYLLSCNVAEAFSLVAGLLAGIPSLFYPIQLLYINLITDGPPALALSFAPKAEHIMHELPSKKMEILSKRNKFFIFSVGTAATIIVLFSYFFFAGSPEFRRTIAFTILALIQSFIFLDVWLSHHSPKKHFKKLLSFIFLLAFITPFATQYLLVTFPSLAQIFKVQVLPTPFFLLLIVVSSAILFFMKIFKAISKWFL